jgi:hypothetical protein
MFNMMSKAAATAAGPSGGLFDPERIALPGQEQSTAMPPRGNLLGFLPLS